ncbi:MAG: hypothetical protein ACTSV7_09075 [Candidatus Baldrarchaeia archaeon]
MKVSTPEGFELYNFFKCIKEVTVEPTFVFDSEGLKVRELDPSHVAMVDAIAKRKMFEEWEIYESVLDWVFDDNPLRVNVDLEYVIKYLNVEKESNMEIWLENSQEKIVFSVDEVLTKIPTLNHKRTEEIPKPNVTFEAKMLVEAKPLLKLIENWNKHTEEIIFETDGEKLKLTAKAGYDNVTLEKTLNKEIIASEFKTPQKAVYGIKWIRDMLKALQKMENTVEIQFSTNKPIKMTAITKNLTQIDYYLAPRIP